MKAPSKLTGPWGVLQAREIWDNFLSRFDVDWDGKTVLDVGCSWGYVGMHLLADRGVAVVHGVDPVPAWEKLQDGTRPEETEGLHLHQGDARTVKALQEERFDVVISSGTLMLVAPTELHDLLAWALDHLRPGGDCLIDTRTFLSPIGGDLQETVAAPLPHLLFSRRVVSEHLERRGKPPARYTNPLCAATYLMLFHRVGFEFVGADRLINEAREPAYEEFADKLAPYDPAELRTARLQAHLRRPRAPVDASELMVGGAEGTR